MKIYKIHKDVVCLQRNEASKPLPKQAKKKRSKKQYEPKEIETDDKV